MAALCQTLCTTLFVIAKATVAVHRKHKSLVFVSKVLGLERK